MIKSAELLNKMKRHNQSANILFLKPVFKQMIWGGTKMSTHFGYNIPGEQTGECWTVSAHPSGDCEVYTKLNSSPFDGMLLSELWDKHKELFGGLPGDRFPLLIKIIDAKEDLSIQVHPDDTYASKHENNVLGKTECWYILDCDPSAQIVIGHHAKTKDELTQMIIEKRWSDLICIDNIQAGDFFQIEPGTIHAIKAGTLILEIQQSSDLTYRLYDYDRLEKGKSRELHLAKSLDVITCPFRKVTDCRSLSKQEMAKGVFREKLIRCIYYDVDRIEIKGFYVFTQQEPFTILCVINGTGMIDGIPIKKGDFFIVPCGYGSYSLAGNLELIKVIS